jgi:hypothetical protein
VRCSPQTATASVGVAVAVSHVCSEAGHCCFLSRLGPTAKFEGFMLEKNEFPFCK